MNKIEKKLAGYSCCHIPQELIHSAGIIPYHINGRGDLFNKSSEFLPTDFCMYGKSCLNEVFAINREKFAGLIFSNSCDSMERLYDICNNYINLPFIHMMDIPRKKDEPGMEYFRRQIIHLKYTLETYKSCEITEEELKKSISAYNRLRETFREIRDLRINHSIKTSEIMELILDKEKKPEEIIEKLQKAKEKFTHGNDRPKILLAGSVMEDVSIFKIIEDAGGYVAYEDFCSVNRLLDHPVNTSIPPIEGLAERYLNKNFCPRLSGSSKEKINSLKNIIKTYNINGIIFYIIKFCDIYSWETHLVSSEIRSLGIPFLVIEGDYPIRAKGQLITRIQAFMEMVGEI